MPGVGRLRTAADGGHLRGGAPRAVWQAVGADPAVISARSAAERLSELGRAGHLSWNPLTGEIVQPASVLRGILDWLDSWGVSRRWPAGPPVAYPRGQTGCGSRRLWARGGHFGASQVPGWAAAGPGGIDIERLTGRVQLSAAGTGQPPPEPAHGGPECERPGQDQRRKQGQRTGLAEFDDIFERRPAAGSLTRVG